jgi:hypothetical protein
MSWSASGTATVRTKSGGEGVGVRLDMNHSQPQTGHGAVESEKALATAQRVARVLLESGAYGTGTFTVGLSGHANPDNKPAPGWSNEFVSITINQQQGE